MSKVIVIGGGAAGMMAAISAADIGHRVTLLEKNGRLGKKLVITGKGRCNVTNDSDVENLLNHTVSNPKFLYSAFYSFDSQRMMQFLEDEGLRLKTERGNRVFPESDRSFDVIDTLRDAMKKRGVQVRLDTRVAEVCRQDGHVSGVMLEDGTMIPAQAVVVATGGLSYPSTGSTGDGYQMAEKTGHHMVKPVPSLVPMNVCEDAAARMQGLSLRNVLLSMYADGNLKFREQGEMLFTHFGVSGPLVLSASTILAGLSAKRIELEIDMKPALSEKQLDERILRDFAAAPNMHFKNSLGRLLPAKMVPEIVLLSRIDPDKPVNSVTRQERAALCNLIKHFRLTVAGPRGYNEAIITHGGVSVRDVDPATMQSKRLPGLYFAGEVLDLDAVTGGYNLQIAWSTGYLAGISIS